MKIAYLMSRFPKITETFILYEILALQSDGVSVEIFPLQREKTRVMHSEARKLMPRVTFSPWLSFTILSANIRFACKSPKRYFSTLMAVLKGTLGCSNYFFGAIAFFPKAIYMAKLCQQSNINHIHAHFASHPALVAYIISALTGIGYSFTAHGSDIHKRQKMLAEKIDHSRFAVMISQYNKKFVSQKTGYSNDEKMPVIHCGIDLERFKPSEKHAASCQPVVNLLCVASLGEVKGHRFLLEACRILKDRQVSFVLNLVGDGPNRDNITLDIKKHNLKQQVILHGALAQSEVVTLLQKNDVFVLTSYQTPSGSREGIPMVLMEAMACGLAVVASDISGIPELVDTEKTGLLTKVEDPIDIADQLERVILDSNLRNRLGCEGRNKVIEDFNLHKNCKELINLFRQYVN